MLLVLVRVAAVLNSCQSHAACAAMHCVAGGVHCHGQCHVTAACVVEVLSWEYKRLVGLLLESAMCKGASAPVCVQSWPH